jgi:hypothetical protein
LANENVARIITHFTPLVKPFLGPAPIRFTGHQTRNCPRKADAPGHRNKPPVDRKTLLSGQEAAASFIARVPPDPNQEPVFLGYVSGGLE